MILSMHFEKCGGTTLRSFWKDQFSHRGDPDNFLLYEPHLKSSHNELSQLVQKSPAQQDVADLVVHGHYGYGLHQRLPSCVEYEYVTVVRDPTARFVSHFNHWSNWGSCPPDSLVSKNKEQGKPKIGLEEYVTRPATSAPRREVLCNLMTKRLAGVALKNRATESDYLKALAILQTFALVGHVNGLPSFYVALTSRYDLASTELDPAVKLNTQVYKRAKYGLPSMQLKELTQDALDLIHAMNYWDHRLVAMLGKEPSFSNVPSCAPVVG